MPKDLNSPELDGASVYERRKRLREAQRVESRIRVLETRLVIPSVTLDPVSPVVGQVWLRVDLLP